MDGKQGLFKTLYEKLVIGSSKIDRTHCNTNEELSIHTYNVHEHENCVQNLNWGQSLYEKLVVNSSEIDLVY